MELPTTISKYPLTTKDYFQLEDLLAYYPPADTPEIQTLFTAKKEFNELASPPDEKPPKRGEYYNHQKLIQRLMRTLDRLLILHEAGTGKTCTMISVGEFYEMMSQTLFGMNDSLLRQGFPIRKTYVLIRNPILKDEFYNQLVCVCTKENKYLDSKWIKEARDEKIRAYRVRKEVGRWYKVMGYRDFANKVYTRKVEIDSEGNKNITFIPKISDERLKKKFSNCLFFADEIHNLRNVEGDFGELSEDDKESNLMNYAALWKVFHTAQNIKIMLATATPMINRPADLVPTLNLLLPRNKQVEDGTDFGTWSLEKFEKLVRGLISYVRVLDTGIDIIYQGEMVEGVKLEVAGEEVDSTTIIEASVMSEFQSRAYLDAELKETTDVRSTGIRKPARHASNFVFPRKITIVDGDPTFDDNSIGLYGTEGFNEYVEETRKGNYKFKKSFNDLIKQRLVEVQTEDGDQVVTSEELYTPLPVFSQKFYDIVQLCETNSGSSFCYTDDFAVASGAILLGLCFEVFGYKRYNTDAPAFEVMSSRTSVGFCAKDANVERKIKVTPAKRYAIISSGIEQETIRNILSLFNSKENMNGDYIKVIIVSRKGREGINLFNVQNVHLVNPSWNQSNMYQATFRAIRATSHVEILNELRKKAIQEGKDPNDVRVIVRIYQHASVISSDEEIRELAEKLGNPNISVELQMYQLSEQKDRNNAVVMRMLKQCAIDCQIQKPRNQRPQNIDVQKPRNQIPQDIDGSSICDYTTCGYDCVNPSPKDIDFTTYDVYYKDELVEKIKKKLIELFEIKNTYTASEIFDAIEEFPAKFVLQGLSEMIKDKVTFTNRYGYTSFLNENGNSFFLVNELNTYSTEAVEDLYKIDVNSIGKTEYNENLYAVGRKDFIDTISTIRKPLYESKIVQLLSSNTLLKDIETIDEIVLISLIENLLLKEIKKEPLNDQQKKVLQKYKNLIYVTNEPISLIDEVIESRAEPSVPKRGRKKKTDAPVKITKLKEDIDIDEIQFGDEEVIVHLLNLLRTDSANFRTTSKFNKADADIRIFKISEGQWRDATDIETLAYNRLIQARRKKVFEEKFGDQRIYGTILQDGKFRIIDKFKEDKKAADNAHYSITGRECVHGFKFQDLTDILQTLDIKPEDYDLEPNPQAYGKTKAEIEKFLINSNQYKTINMSMEDLIYAARWASIPRIVKNDLCKLIQTYLDENDLLYKLVL